MITLCLELSSRYWSILLRNESKEILQQFDTFIHKTRESFFYCIKELLYTNSICPEDINLLAVNTGPGSYTGIRISIVSAEAIALPKNIPVIGINTAEILAGGVSNIENNEVTVIGNAHKNMLWLTNVSFTPDGIPVSKEFRLIETYQLASYIKNINSSIITSEYEQIKSLLPEKEIIKANLDIRILYKIAIHRFKEGILKRPIPIYLHPAAVKREQ